MKKTIKTLGDQEVMALRNQLAHALADYDNLRKRVERQKEEFEKLANLRLVVKLLPVLDILKQAQNHLKDQGIAITLKEFEGALAEEDIEEIPVKVGDIFDPNLEEVIETVDAENEAESGKIAEVVLTGWRIKDGPIIRHTKVKVFAKKI